MKAREKKRLILVDGSAMTYRAFFAFINNPLRNSKGENVSAIFGVANSLLKILREHEFTHIAVCFDTPKPTFRHELYAEYKATREKMPDELSVQLPLVKDLITALGIPVIEEEGYEADDVIGTLTKRAATRECAVTLISFDKDFYQLLTMDNVSIIKPGRGKVSEETISKGDVKKKLGIAAEKVVDYLALVGDTSDNVPGVTGVGPKTAVKLLNEFESVGNLVKRRDQIAMKRVRETLDEEQLMLSRRLVTIDTDVELSTTIASLEYQGKDNDRLRHLFSELDFTSLMGELDEGPETSLAFEEVSLEQLVAVLKKVKNEASIECILIDGASCLALATSSGVWVTGIVSGDAKQIGALKSLLGGKKVMKISSNVKELLHMLNIEEIDTKSTFFDIGLASYLLDPSRGSHDLDSVALRFMNAVLLKKEDLLKQFKKEEISSAVLQGEIAKHAHASLSLFGKMEKELRNENVEQLFLAIEMPLIGVLARMEDAGIMLDVDFFAGLSTDYEKMIKEIERNVYNLAGETFNIRSTKQLQQILYDKLKLMPTRKTKTGYSTDSDSLLALSSAHELPKEILRYRELYKLKSTYIDALPRLSDGNSRIHTTFVQTTAATGRLSSRNPNLQNIPARGDLGREIRKGFIAPHGRRLLSCDYSQIELRILAHLSQDKNLQDGFFKKHDIHARTAASVFGLPEADITREMRRRAKIVNFGIIYGMSPYGLAQELNITPEEGAVIINSYFKTYPGVKDWIDRIVEEATQQGCTETLLGRKRKIPELASDNFNTREFGKRIAINTPVQGSAADIIKQAMIRIEERLKAESVDAIMVLQIHDELLFEVKQDAVEDAARIIVEEMEQVLELSVPLVVDVGMGKNWFEAH
jgi:DNA polymerase-1